MAEIKKQWGHTSVLLHEVIAQLDLKPGDIFLDGTVGSGGHSEAIAKQYGAEVTIIGLDADPDAIVRTKERLAQYKTHVVLINENFRNIDTVLSNAAISSVNKILLDLGFSSNQLEESGRGFSFQKDEPLEMTFGTSKGEETITAKTILNEWGEDTIGTILWGYGGERYARRIASKIIQARARAPILMTHELVRIIHEATPRAYHHGKINPATRTFQALRIAVNDELTALEEVLAKGFDLLAPQGRIAVIAFHSLEDRIVKNFFKKKAEEKTARIITKRPITATEEEISTNKRSRSAKLRILLKE